MIPVVPTPVLWVLGLGIGFFLIFGFAAWSSVPSRVVKIPHHHVGTATGLMLTLAAVGGYFVPEMFGHLVPRTNYSTGWYVLGIISFAFALVGLLGRDADPLTSETQDSAGSATREHTTTPETTV